MTEARRKVERWDSCGRAWIAVLRHVWTAGEAGLEERGAIIEGPPIFFEISSLSWEDPILREYGQPPGTLPLAGREPGVLAGRGAAALAGRDPAGELASYQARLHDLQGVDQLRWVVDLLRARPWTTNAWISLTVPGERGDTVPCLAALSFRIRGYRLIMTAMFRSQNVFGGYQSYIPLRAVQLEVAEDLALPAGPLRVFIDLPHLYVADAEQVAEVLSAMPAPNAA